MGASADWICKRYEALLQQRRLFEPLWEDIAFHMRPSMGQMPWNGNFNTALTSPTDTNSLLFDGTAARAANTFASGQCAYLTPPGQSWFVYDPPTDQSGVDQVEQWYQKCTEIALEIFSKSNFYVEAQNYYADDGTFGTATMFCEPGKDSPIFFKSLTIGTYVIKENYEGIVDHLFVEDMWKTSDCVDKFGLDKCSPKMQKAYAEEQKNGSAEKDWKIIHAMYPRSAKDRVEGKADGQNKPYASVWVEKDNKHTLQDSGYDEKPFFTARYAKYGVQPYGSCPAWQALPDSRQLNELVKVLDNLAEVKANPRFLMPSSHDGEVVDLRAGGRTFVDDEAFAKGAVPKEWLTQGDYNIGLDRENRKAEAINEAFYVDLFKLFAGLDKGQMTAREIAAREGEKLNQFIPSFLRKTTELFNPLLTRSFGILFRGGYFPEPPQEALKVDKATGRTYIDDPNITYSSRVALAIQAQQNGAFGRTMEVFTPMIALNPGLMDNFDQDTIIRDGARNEGFPADWFTSEEDRDKTREARAEQQAKMEAQQNALTAAKTAADASKAVPAIQSLQAA